MCFFIQHEGMFWFVLKRCIWRFLVDLKEMLLEVFGGTGLL